MEKELLKIANTLLLYSYHIENPGLLNGRMGIVLYLYQYARYAGRKYYCDFADDLLDKVLDSVNHSSPDFESGISGIGWGVNYLIKNKYVEGDVNDVLFDIDKRVFYQLSCDPSASLLGQGIYLLERLPDNESNEEFDKYINQLLDFCYKGISGYKGTTSLYHLNSILYFLEKISVKKNCEAEVDQIMRLLPHVLKKIHRYKLYDKVDHYIFHRFQINLSPQLKKYWKDVSLLNSDETVGNLDIASTIKLWNLENLYFGISTIKEMSFTDIFSFVKQKQESLEKTDFILYKGLAGLGSVLLTISKNDTVN
ncbi:MULTISPECIES: lanthionine synthetase LanC family protein [Dysgonomonas]|uniref:Lantibiotic biosynthesis protein dehydration domain-containing protein n=1 Tax=Dysgonomonas gadei ATCC BAA-286 TaxID=742766 RepID=F5J3V1_9BACT|nr:MULTISPECIES: lanthionine synthetase LanC family protein [Dysgonomonas]EGJ99604.1 hypothetical protein HMPREF9455_04018 [Dysgonomonas gadei ATCC BAA-286]MBF0650824.1 hypothetical protein [Dysgonomonas sp. GY75]